MLSSLAPEPPPGASPIDAEPPASALRRARAAIAATFALSGFVFASWAVRVPDLADQTSASHAALGGALLCVSLGALLTMAPTGAVAARLGAGRVAAAGAALASVAVVVPALVHSVPALGATLVAFGASTGLLNVAMNSVGVRLEETTRSSVLPRLHAAFSLGAMAGSLSGGLAAAQLSPATHLAGVAALGLLTTAGLRRTLVRTDGPRPRHPVEPASSADGPAVSARWTVLGLGAIAACTAYGEGALSDWGALHLVDLGATSFTAAAGYAGFSLAMAAGRLGGHRLQELIGATGLLVGGAVTAAAGMLLAALSDGLAPTLLGFVVVGLGFANIFPVAIARAGALGGPRAVGMASTVGYTGLLVGPALIGLLASAVGLPVALTTVSVLSVVAAGLALAVHDADAAATSLSVWSYAEVTARLRTSLRPFAARTREVAQRHADALTVLSPRTDGVHRGRPLPAREHGIGTRYLDLDALLGDGRHRLGTAVAQVSPSR